jgi:hypothetical protein
MYLYIYVYIYIYIYTYIYIPNPNLYPIGVASPSGGRTPETMMGPAPGYDGGETMTILRRSVMLPVRSLKAPVTRGLRKSKMNNLETLVSAKSRYPRQGSVVNSTTASRNISRENSSKIETDTTEGLIFPTLSSASGEEDHRKRAAGEYMTSFEPVLKPPEPLAQAKFMAAFLSIKVLEDLENSNMFTNRDLVAYAMAVDRYVFMHVYIYIYIYIYICK